MADNEQATEVEDVAHTSLGKALLGAMREIGAVRKKDVARVRYKNKKTGQWDEYTYDYTSSEDMILHVRSTLLRHGVLWGVTDWRVDRTHNPPEVIGTTELEHPASNERRPGTVVMPAASGKDADKGTAGALTYLLGNATRCRFLIPKSNDTDDPDKRTTEGVGFGREEPRATERRAPDEPAPASPEVLGRRVCQSMWERVRERAPTATWGLICEAAEVPVLSLAAQRLPALRLLRAHLKYILEAPVEREPGDDGDEPPVPYDPPDGKGAEVPAGD